MVPQINIGVLALQGAYSEHVIVLSRLGLDCKLVKNPSDLSGLDGLILPGGESTTMALLAHRNELIEPLRTWVASKPTWGICAGMILLADVAHAVKKGGQERIQGLHVSVLRNAFGHQVDSFTSSHLFQVLSNPELPFPTVFIRAPLIESLISQDVQVIGRLPPNGSSVERIIAVKQGNILATSFHPELTPDTRFHEYFLDMVKLYLESI